MSEKIINMDELVGFIIRNLADNRGIDLTYREVSEVLELEESFLRSKGLVEDDE